MTTCPIPGVSVRCPPPNGTDFAGLVSTIDSGHLGALYGGEAEEASSCSREAVTIVRNSLDGGRTDATVSGGSGRHITTQADLRKEMIDYIYQVGSISSENSR